MQIKDERFKLEQHAFSYVNEILLYCHGEKILKKSRTVRVQSRIWNTEPLPHLRLQVKSLLNDE